MGIRWGLAAFLIPTLTLGGSAGSAFTKEATRVASSKSARTKKLDVKINAIPWSDLRLKVRKQETLPVEEGILGPGDFWTPEMLQKVQRGK